MISKNQYIRSFMFIVTNTAKVVIMTEESPVFSGCKVDIRESENKIIFSKRDSSEEIIFEDVSDYLIKAIESDKGFTLFELDANNEAKLEHRFGEPHETPSLKK